MDDLKDPAHERFHEPPSHPPGELPWWGEWWWFEFTLPDAGLACQVRIARLPHQGRYEYWACLTGAGRFPVVVLDNDVPPPRRDGSLEIRTDGLWADHILEQPFEQVTVGCEAFALRIDSPSELDSEPVLGERVPFGMDMEWETIPVGAPATPLGLAADPGAGSALTGYRLPCEAHGLVLVGDDELHLEAQGARAHAWGDLGGPYVPKLT